MWVWGPLWNIWVGLNPSNPLVLTVIECGNHVETWGFNGTLQTPWHWLGLGISFLYVSHLHVLGVVDLFALPCLSTSLPRKHAYTNVSHFETRTCQERDWPEHKRKCGKVKAFPTGLPFVISLPANQLTYSRLMEYAETFSRYVIFHQVFTAAGSFLVGTNTSLSKTELFKTRFPTFLWVRKIFFSEPQRPLCRRDCAVLHLH